MLVSIVSILDKIIYYLIKITTKYESGNNSIKDTNNYNCW